MLLLKIFFTTYQPSPDKGRLTCYELISYPFEIIIGLQKYGMPLNMQNTTPEYWVHPIHTDNPAIEYGQQKEKKKRDCK